MASPMPALDSLDSHIDKENGYTSSDLFQGGEKVASVKSVYGLLIEKALNRAEKGDETSINVIREQIDQSLKSSTSAALSPEHLEALMLVLTREIGRLDNSSCARLISSILKLSWQDKSKRFVNVFVEFLAVLVSGIPKWWTEVASKMVAGFCSSDTSRHHAVLQYILRLVPTSANLLEGVCKKHMPNKFESSKATSNYISNLITLTQYCPDVQRAVWTLIMDYVVQLDTEISEAADDENLDEDQRDQSDVELDDLDEGEYSSDDTCSESSQDDFVADDDDELADHELNIENFDSHPLKLRQKLDRIVCLLLDSLDEQFTIERIVSRETNSLYTMLLDLFRQFIIPTHQTEAVQFLIFKVCHSHPDLLDAFLVSLINLALSPQENTDRRQKAMQYISSFVARAAGLSRAQIVFVIAILTSWINKFLEDWEADSTITPGSCSHLRVFYSTCQALFYIFCFRHSMLKSSPEPEWELNLDKFFRRLIICKFNPLKYCKPTVVAMFAKVAQSKDVAYCFTIMEQNRLGGFRSADNSSATAAHVLSNNHPNALTTKNMPDWTRELGLADDFFPFDPPPLPRVRVIIKNNYLEWSQVAEITDSDSGDSD